MYNLRTNLRRYGLTPEQLAEKVAAQGNCCAICGEPPDPSGIKAASRLHVDHDHVTGVNRDLLCVRCNQGIGYFKDDPVLFRAAAEYIERHRAAQ
jgi:Recombination endonuclease VII